MSNANGILVTKKAIKNKDILLLKRCPERFVEIKASVTDVQMAIEDCPIDLIEKTGIKFAIFSEILNRKIIVGQDISFAALIELVRLKPEKETIASMFEAQQITFGEIKNILP